MSESSSTPLVIKSLLTRGVAEFVVHERFSIDSFISRFAIGRDECVLERDDLGTVMYGFINVITMIAGLPLPSGELADRAAQVDDSMPEPTAQSGALRVC